MSGSDVHSPEQRRRNMAAVRTRDTGPELKVRQALYARGLRYRLHRRDLPGTPDIVFGRKQIAIFVHGCFWHGHGCSLSVMPKGNAEFWANKIARNRERDRAAEAKLLEQRWRVATIWECSLRGRNQRGIDAVADGIVRWMSGKQKVLELMERVFRT